jgi:hypothetical protein
MASQLKPQVFPEKEPTFYELKVGKVYTKYRAWIGPYIAKGITMGPEDKVKEVVRRMAHAKAEPLDVIKSLVESVAEYMSTASESGLMDIGVVLGTFFHLGEYMAIMVKLQRLSGPYSHNRVWGEIKVMFKGYDGLKALSKHVVMRYVEFYAPNKVDKAQLYNVLYEAARIAYNAYGWAHKNL